MDSYLCDRKDSIGYRVVWLYVEAGRVFRYFVSGEGREVVMEVGGIELHSYQ